MGFKVKHKEIVIKFDDEEYEGLEIVARAPTVREALEAEKLSKISGEPTAKDLDKIFAYVAKFILRWNIEDDEGKALPINAAAFIDFPTEFAWAIVSGFTQGSSGVSAPLDNSSLNGEISPAVSVPMETL